MYNAEIFLNLMIHKAQLTQRRTFLKERKTKKQKTISSKHTIIKFLNTHCLSGIRVEIVFLSFNHVSQKTMEHPLSSEREAGGEGELINIEF